MNTAVDFSLNVLPRPMPAAMSDALRARFAERFVTSLAVREQHGRDESPFDAPPPEAVVFCESTEDVAFVVATRRRAPRAGDSVRRRLVAGRPSAGGAGRRQRRRVAHGSRCCSSTPTT